MYRIKGIKLYFLSILNLFFLSFRNIYFKTNFYNKKLITFIPDRIFYSPSTYLSSSLTTITSDFYKITNTSTKLLWENNVKDKSKLINRPLLQVWVPISSSRVSSLKNSEQSINSDKTYKSLGI